MPAMRLTEKEAAFLKCAEMILADQCPPDCKHYLCVGNTDHAGCCARCWNNYLWGIGMGTIELPKSVWRGATV